MATKFYCDGCDKELTPKMVQHMSVSVKKNGEFSAVGGNYELCERCAGILCRESNPNNWVRAAKEIKRASA